MVKVLTVNVSHSNALKKVKFRIFFNHGEGLNGEFKPFYCSEEGDISKFSSTMVKVSTYEP